MMKNMFWRILIVGLMMASGTGLASASTQVQPGHNSIAYPSHFDNMAYINESNSVLFSGTLKFTQNSSVKPIHGGLVQLTITFNPLWGHPQVVYNENCTTDQNGRFKFNIDTSHPMLGRYDAVLSYAGNSTYGPCQNSTHWSLP